MRLKQRQGRARRHRRRSASASRPMACGSRPNPAEQQILARMRDLRAAGVTLRGIAAELNRDGFTTRRGTAWRFEYVARVLRIVTDARDRAVAA